MLSTAGPDVGPEAEGEACLVPVMLLPPVHSAHVDLQ